MWPLTPLSVPESSNSQLYLIFCCSGAVSLHETIFRRHVLDYMLSPVKSALVLDHFEYVFMG